MNIPMSLADFERPDYLTAFFFLREKDAENKVQEYEQDRYEILALHPDNTKPRYRMLSVYVMPCDVLIEFIRTTTYRIVSIRRLRKQNHNQSICKKSFKKG